MTLDCKLKHNILLHVIWKNKHKFNRQNDTTPSGESAKNHNCNNNNKWYTYILCCPSSTFEKVFMYTRSSEDAVGGVAREKETIFQFSKQWNENWSILTDNKVVIIYEKYKVMQIH